MKRTLIALASVLIVASGANAATMSIDTDKATYAVGELITITATLTTVAGDTFDSAVGSAISLETSWNSANAFVANRASPAGFGTASQNVTVGPTMGTPNISSLNGAIPWTGGSPLACVSAGAGAGNTCILLSQSLLGLAFGPDVGQILVGTLVLQATELGSLGLVVASAAYLGGGITGAGDVSIGGNYAVASVGNVVPEPTTAAMLSLGLLGLSLAGRRRN